MTNYARTFGQDLMRGEHKVAPKKGDLAGGVLMSSRTSADPDFYTKKRAKEAELGLELTTEEFLADHYAASDAPTASGTSIFDPVLTELAYRWFCPPGGTVLDPFAGGSVRGIVASVLGYAYHGCELRAEQVAANLAQAHLGRGTTPQWYCGDSREIETHCAGVSADFVFSCPPYADLEVYSDDPRDISAMDYAGFRAAYAEIIAAACRMLRQDRFACFVVGEVRDRKGYYRNFVGDTVAAFEAAGLRYYNEAILITSVGSLPVRAGRQFKAGRKLGKTHQNILVFVKGDGKRAARACEGPDAETTDDGET